MKRILRILRQRAFVSRFFRWLFQDELRAMENHVIHNFKEDAIRQLNEAAQAREMVDDAIKTSRATRFTKRYGR